MKQAFLLTFLVLILSTALPLRAQGGIVASGSDDSPENPTVILAFVGSAGGLFAPPGARLKARRK